MQRGFTSRGSVPLPRFALDSLWEVVVALASGFTAVAADAPELWLLDLHTLAWERRVLINDSLCPACATHRVDTAEEAEITLHSRTKPTPSTYRLLNARAVELREQDYVNPLSGPLGVRCRSELLNGFTAPVSGNFRVWSKYSDHPAFWSGHDNTYRGSTVKGVMEGLERYSSWRSRSKAVSVIGSLNSLGSQALDPTACGVYDDSFYQSHAHYVPFSPDLKCHWVWGYSLIRNQPTLVPEQLVYYLDHRKGHRSFVQECSNGSAAGSCPEEAILHGLLELIERDTFLLVWNARLAPPRIDPWSIQHRETILLVERLFREAWDLHLFDTRLDIPVPSVMGYERRRDGALGTLVFAAGASLNPEEAIRATICEIATYVNGFSQRVESELDTLRAMAKDFSIIRGLGDHANLYGLPEMEHHAAFLQRGQRCESVDAVYRSYRKRMPRGLDLKQDVQYLLTSLRAIGLDVIVVDQTSPEQARLGLCTFRCIVPGLIPIDFGHVRNRAQSLPRLRTVPKAAGYRVDEFDVAEINPAPHPFP